MTDILPTQQSRPVFILSDRTAVTTGTMCHSLLSQFPHVEFERYTIPFVDTDDKVKTCIKQINRAFEAHAIKPLVFTSFIDTDYTKALESSHGIVIDLFKPFLSKIEQYLHVDSSHKIGQAHGMQDRHDYMHRIDAINFTMKYDDGVRLHDYHKADLILVGVSRAGKTPTSLYMALHYGLSTANYPLADDDFENGVLPEALINSRKMLFGLTIDPLQLHKIRQKRRPDSPYSALKQCQIEVRLTEQLFKRYRLPYSDSTAMSIEELASSIVHRMNLSVNYL